MSEKEKAIRIVPQVKSINIVFTAILTIAAFALISIPQMIGVANAQSDRASERACPVEGYTLSRGECTADPIRELKCEPSTLAGVPVLRDNKICSATGPTNVITGGVCDSVEGERQVTGGRPPQATCRFAATEVISCPGGVIPTAEGECITKPGRGNDPTV